MTTSSQTVKIKGELFWSRWMGEFNTKFNETNTRYECTIGNLDDESVKSLKSLGIKIKNKDTMGNYIVSKSKFLFNPTTKDGKEVPIAAIGNGTEITAVVGSYAHKMSKMHGNAPSIAPKTLIVTNLKTYVPDEENLDDAF
jgi:hypothetical protein